MLETERLILRPYVAGDAAALEAILTDPITMRFWPAPFTPEEAASWMRRSMERQEELGFARWPVRQKETGQVIGDCGIMRAEVDGETVNDIGWIIHHPWWGRGYATEAARALVHHAFTTLGLEYLVANMACDNEASRNVAEKLGMRQERVFSNTRNRNLPTYLYRLRNALHGSV